MLVILPIAALMRRLRCFADPRRDLNRRRGDQLGQHRGDQLGRHVADLIGRYVTAAALRTLC